MGPFNERRQMERAGVLARLLQQDLSPWAREFWSRTLRELARNEETYNYRVKTTYQKVKQWENPFNE
jgi:hypothetical protein